MISRVTILFFLMVICHIAAAQTSYDAGVLIGFQHTIAQRGPKFKTNVSEVKFVKPICRSFGILFDIKPDAGRLSYGIEFVEDVNDFGYKAESHNLNTSPGLSLVSGKLGAGDWISIYKVGIRVGYSLYQRKKIRLTGFLIPSIGYYKYSSILADTSNNDFWRRNKVEIQYITIPSSQRQGAFFFLKSTLELQYNWNRHFATSFMMSYQQGFTPIVIDTTNIIRPYELTGSKEHKYWTKVTGTALQWHFGFKYTFSGVHRHAAKSEKSEL